MSIKGDLVKGGLKTFLAFFMKRSSVSPRFLIVIPKAQRAITSIVKALNSLFWKLEIILEKNN